MLPRSFFQNFFKGHNVTTKNLVSANQNPTINNSNLNTTLSISPLQPTSDKHTKVLPNESNVMNSPLPFNSESMSYPNLVVISPTLDVSHVSDSDVSQPSTHVYHQPDNSNTFQHNSHSYSTTSLMLAPNELSYSTVSLSPYFHSPSNHISLPLLQNGHPILTRAKTGKSRPKVFLVHTDPATIKQALMFKRIMCYLSGTKTHGLMLAPANSDHKLSLYAYSDFDWASDPDNRRSTSGPCV
ncbi:hypothetical protein KIW84_014869 [Lathyrus oleraceus]|uniref:Uncharacterized protein n=1 Tax=Pisum sativum TaxID=3888 RepID=A0A9D5BNS5_PEA|nr:hypothetical protein KIW84_014869 [Pisum sativum]